MDYNKWSFASNLSTMIIALFAFIAAITYYFSLTDLDLSNKVDSSATISKNGMIYFGFADGFYAIGSKSKGLNYSTWPKFRGNLKNTGNYCDHNECK